MNKNILKSIGAVFAGFITVFVLSVITDVVLEKNGLLKIEAVNNNALWVYVTVVICRFIYTVVGSYLTAKLAPARPMRHAMILGTTGLVLNIVGAIVLWDKTPHWFPVILAIIPLPCAWLGGMLKK